MTGDNGGCIDALVGVGGDPDEGLPDITHGIGDLARLVALSALEESWGAAADNIGAPKAPAISIGFIVTSRPKVPYRQNRDAVAAAQRRVSPRPRPMKIKWVL